MKENSTQFLAWMNLAFILCTLMKERAAFLMSSKYSLYVQVWVTPPLVATERCVKMHYYHIIQQRLPSLTLLVDFLFSKRSFLLDFSMRGVMMLFWCKWKAIWDVLRPRITTRRKLYPRSRWKTALGIELQNIPFPCSEKKQAHPMQCHARAFGRFSPVTSESISVSQTRVRPSLIVNWPVRDVNASRTSPPVKPDQDLKCIFRITVSDKENGPPSSNWPVLYLWFGKGNV